MPDAEGAAERLELILALNKFSDRIDGLSRASNHSTSHVQLTTGGWGVWVSVTCCLVMLAVMALAVPIGAAAYLDARAQIRQLENTDNAIRAYINTGKMPPAPKGK